MLEPPGPGRHPEVQEAEAGDHPVTGEILKVQQMPLRAVQGDPVNWAKSEQLKLAFNYVKPWTNPGATGKLTKAFPLSRPINCVFHLNSSLRDDKRLFWDLDLDSGL